MTIATLSRGLITAEDRYQPHSSHPEHSAPEACVFRHWRHHTNVPGPQRLQMKGPWPTSMVQGTKASVHVSHGRWCVECPADPFVCRSSQYASKRDRRFFCVQCGKGWFEVVWPDDLTVAAIEAALMVRPELETRNWFPGESVEDLIAENKAHGIA